MGLRARTPIKGRRARHNESGERREEKGKKGNLGGGGSERMKEDTKEGSREGKWKKGRKDTELSSKG